MVIQSRNHSLGLLLLDRGLSRGEQQPPSPVGGLRHPKTFDFPVIMETVEGAWADSVLRGDPELEAAYVAAAQRLVQQGAVAIGSNCGSSFHYQSAVASGVDVPVALSSLVLVPTLLAQLPSGAKLGVVTSDLARCREALGGDDFSENVVIGSIEGGTFWTNEMQRPPAPTTGAEIEADAIKCVRKLLEAHPDVAAILVQCTGLVPFTHVIRRMTGLSVYDVTTAYRLIMESVGTE